MRARASKAHTRGISASQIGISLHWSPLEPHTHTGREMTVVPSREFVKMSTGETVCCRWEPHLQTLQTPDSWLALGTRVRVSAEARPRSFCKTNH